MGVLPQEWGSIGAGLSVYSGTAGGAFSGVLWVARYRLGFVSRALWAKRQEQVSIFRF